MASASPAVASEGDAAPATAAQKKPAASRPAHKIGPGERHQASKRRLTDEQRLAAIRRAKVWMPTNVASMDLRAGPRDRGAFQADELVTCDYVQRKLSGTSLKFDCAVGPEDVVKVRYGAVNGKVQGEVLATRLLWALGFGADAVYPVRVSCRGCSRDPWHDREKIPGVVQLFEPAAIERKAKGYELRTETHAGWAWPELNLIDERIGGASQAERDALVLLAVFIQHTDSKPEQQRLVCLHGAMDENGSCQAPFMMLHDVGLTFGRANYFNRTVTGSVNFELWSTTPIWRDAAACRGRLSKSVTGTLGDDPRVSEAGRQFLANLLLQLTDDQLRDLFHVARVDLRSRRPNSSEPPAGIDEWVAAFKHKRDEIVNARCPS